MTPTPEERSAVIDMLRDIADVLQTDPTANAVGRIKVTRTLPLTVRERREGRTTPREQTLDLTVDL